MRALLFTCVSSALGCLLLADPPSLGDGGPDAPASGWIDIGGRTVGEVAEELNRRNHLQIIVRDPAVAALVVPPIPLELDAPETFVSMVSDRKDIAAIRDSAGNVHLQRG